MIYKEIKSRLTMRQVAERYGLKATRNTCLCPFHHEDTPSLHLYKDGFSCGESGYTLIKQSNVYYITSDKRRTIDPVGMVSDSLEGYLSYFLCNDYYRNLMNSILSQYGIKKVVFLPTSLAESLYLIPSEARDEYALFLDSGYLSTTVCVLLGNGVLAQRTFWTGCGQIAVRLMETFSMPYQAAAQLLRKTNLYAKKGAGKFEFEYAGESYFIDSDALIEAVKEGLDELCEAASGFFEECAGRELDYKPLYISGEGITQIRGAMDHVSKRLNRVTEELYPSQPYYDKPTKSTQLALTDMASSDYNKSRFLSRLFGGFGG